jgi:outer membrane protein OmpA-like peptidoglycan-associated protein
MQIVDMNEVKDMKSSNRVILSLAVAAALAACSTAPPSNESLESARTMIPQVEQSARAGVAAADIANARHSLDAANRLAAAKAKSPDIEFEAQNAILSAQIANEKILTAQANEEVAAGNAQRQTVLLQARDRQAQQSARDAELSALAAGTSQQRVDSLEAQLADLKAKKTDRGLVLTLGDVLFDTNQSTLKAGAYGTLDRLAMALRENSGRKVIIEGHTDNVGSDATNQALSERRAQSVQMALTQRGVARDQITAIGKGENFPVASNDDANGRQTNRRVELIFAEDSPRITADQP